MKKIFVACCICVVSLFCVQVKAQDISNCDYDDFIIGSGSLEIANGKYVFHFETEMDSYAFEGNSSDPLVPQLQKALAEAKPDPDGMFDKSIALLTSMDAPVGATAYEIASLYIQPNIVEKASYYIVGVCIPETSECWKVKIMKFSPAASRIKNGILNLEGEVAVVYYTDDGTVISMCEDMNSNY